MKTFVKHACIIFCVIFTVLVLIHFLRGEALTGQVVASFIIISLFSSAMSFLLKDNEKISGRRVILQQIIYLTAIMAAIIGISYYGGWKLSVGIAAINFIIVMSIYILIKFLLYKEDKKEAESINAALKNRTIGAK